MPKIRLSQAEQSELEAELARAFSEYARLMTKAGEAGLRVRFELGPTAAGRPGKVVAHLEPDPYPSRA
jgi:hypothetical protein